MIDEISPNDRIYRFRPYQDWDVWTKVRCHIPNAVRKHMVLVIGESPTTDDWLVVTITTTVSPGIDRNLFVPIAPTPRHAITNLQLHLVDDPYGNRGLPRRSYLRVNRVYEVPDQALVEQRSHHRDLELQQESFDELIEFMEDQGILW
ncbi:hypothetical protein TgHK011_003350 [Trichoderma gracile]|nr:hypothetical protein TgHK011_003350 [Trichoderma gracile]